MAAAPFFENETADWFVYSRLPAVQTA